MTPLGPASHFELFSSFPNIPPHFLAHSALTLLIPNLFVRRCCREVLEVIHTSMLRVAKDPCREGAVGVN